VTPIDPGGVLCALVLAPATLSRNRFFGLFTEAPMRRARVRARQIRALVRQLVDPRFPIDELEEATLPDGRTRLRFTAPSIGYVRTALLDPLEASALRYALHVATAYARPLGDADRARVEHALASLGPDAPRTDPRVETGG
jgi:hypothetical protein